MWSPLPRSTQLHTLQNTCKLQCYTGCPAFRKLNFHIILSFSQINVANCPVLRNKTITLQFTFKFTKPLKFKMGVFKWKSLKGVTVTAIKAQGEKRYLWKMAAISTTAKS